MTQLRYVPIAVLLLVAVSCASSSTNPKASQMQIREFQTREFEADSRTVMKACLNALQDDGYIVKNAVPDLGLLTATKQIGLVKGKAEGVAMNALLIGIAAVLDAEVDLTSPPTTTEMEVSVNVTESGERSKVRANFATKNPTYQGGPVTDEKLYRDFFSKVDKAIFLQKQNL